MPLARGKSIGHYVIHELLGAGGMGEVYEAEDTRLKRRVALKVLPDAVAHDELRRLRFEREAQSVAALNHPNIVTLHSVERADNILFLTMELVDGRPLADLIAKGPIGLTAFFGIAIPVADAVATAHQRGITHRDLKPANIMVTAEGRPKVLDFGLAKAFSVDASPATPETAATQHVTAEGSIVGTAAYMSPEQAEGRTIDGRSDLFSLGAVFYEMLAGERPFKGDSSASVLSSVLRDTPRAVTEINANVPRELWHVLRRCLVKDAEKRLQSAKDLRNELEELRQSLESGEIRAAEPAARSAVSSSVAPLAVPRPRRRGLAVGAALAGLAALGVVAWRLWPVPNAPVADPISATSFTVLTTQAGIEQHPSLSPDGRWMVYASDATGNVDIYLQGVGAQTPINLTVDSPDTDTQPAFSPDGERIAFRSDRDGGGLFVMGRTGELAKKVADRGFNPAWSPDGQQLAFSTQPTAENPGSRGAAGAELWVVALETGGARRLATVSDGLQPAWSPDGSRVAYWGYAPQSRNREIWTVAVDGGEPLRLTDDPAIDWNPVWSPDGRHLYFGSDRAGSFGLWSIPMDSGGTAPEPKPIPLPATYAAHFSLSADGARMVFASYHLSTQVMAADVDVRTGAVAPALPITRGSRAWAYLDVTADGRRVVMTSGYPQEDVFVADATGDNLRQITSDVSSDRGVRWSPDGTRILYYSARPGETMHVFTMKPDGSDVRQVTTEVPSGGSSWVFPQWTPGGDRLAAFSIGAGGYVFESTGAAWRSVALPPVGKDKDLFTPGAWSRDGRRLLGVTAKTGELVVYDFDGQAYDQTGLLGITQQTGMAWLPDSRRALVPRANNIELVDLATRQTTTVIDAPALQTVRQPRLTADGRRLFYLHTANEADLALVTLK